MIHVPFANQRVRESHDSLFVRWALLFAVALLLGPTLASAQVPPTAFEKATLFASEPSRTEGFGWGGLAIDGDTMVVGAPTGFGPDNCSSCGRAYVYERRDGQWVEIAVLLGSDVERGDRFGDSVAVMGDLIFVGAPEPLGGHLGDDDGGDLGAGEVYVFENLVEIAKLEASDARNGDEFGGDLTVAGQTLFVGAREAKHPDSVLSAGAVYVFDPGAGGAGDYQETQKLAMPVIPTQNFEFFSTDLAASGDTLLVTSTGRNVPDSNGQVVWVYERDAQGVWESASTLSSEGSDSGAGFGERLAIEGDTAVVGAFSAMTEHGRTGAAFVFERDASGEWIETATLIEDMAGLAYVGYGVDIEGDIAVVSAGRSGQSRGGAFVYRRNADGSWESLATLLASEGESFDELGFGAALIEGRTVVLPARGDDGACPDLEDCGALYLFGEL